MLLGKLKEGDIPAKTRDECIRTMVASYFHDLPVLISGYGFDMLYAGPREALLHAIVRQNLGATHLIIGRDHAGIGNFYGEFEAQEYLMSGMMSVSYKFRYLKLIMQHTRKS
jgi:sulfate adenylyltransferase